MDDEYAPTTRPQIRLMAKFLISPVLKMERGTMAKSVVRVVMKVLEKD